MDPSQILVQILNAAWTIQIARYVIVAAYALQVYEWLICLSDECLYVHKGRWTTVKLAYLFCRYYPLFVFPLYIWAFVGDHTISTCNKVTRPLYGLMSLFMMSAHVVFVIRTYAFAGRNRFILAFLIACWMGLFIFVTWILSTKYKFILAWHEVVGDSACFGGDISRAAKFVPDNTTWTWTQLYSVSTTVFDSLMTAIIFMHCLRFRSTWGPLGRVIISQGLLAYIMLTVVNIAITVTYRSPDPKWDGIGFLSLIIPEVLACRLILMLRRGADRTATIDDKRQLKIVRDAMVRLEAAEDISIYDSNTASSHSQPIERWD